MNTDQKTVEISNTDSQKLASNLSALIKNNRLSAQQVADELNIPVMTVRRLISGSTTNPTISTLKLFSERFEISIDNLIYGTVEEGIANRSGKSNFKTKHVFVPIIDWETAERIKNIKELNLDEWDEWQQLSVGRDSVSEESFALKSKPTMYPRFSSSTLFIVDPKVSASDGDTILIRIKNNNELTLRLLTIDSPDWDLQSILSDTKSFKYSENEHEIVGVVMLTMLFNKKLMAKQKT